ncbi:hypothetical protein IscW_ISCW018247 [Ixodes scapularis]|uniref:Uncharacterized protein n=1 Tax=Ixodes scapularis TaxID=6945 RepID=B7PHQ4_IXOSC|nr:hypothetical protein IscW_ISCW018247 [Ixodes scapularis]|eukprot:XP_002403374.1 hypothetical protein IscW_ISCW018247 [Ixodes scapularis]
MGVSKSPSPRESATNATVQFFCFFSLFVPFSDWTSTKPSPALHIGPRRMLGSGV